MKKYLFLTIWMLIGSCQTSFISCSDNDGIFDFVPSRDLYAMKSMIEDNCKMLYDVELDGEKTFHQTLETLKYFDTLPGKIFTQTHFLDLVSYAIKEDRYVEKVLRKDGKTIGFMSYFLSNLAPCPLEGWCWVVDNLVIDENYRKNGYGSAMLQYLSEDIKVYGADRLMVFYPESNLVAQEFYRKNGFHIIDGRFDFVRATKVFNDQDISAFDAVKTFTLFKNRLKALFYMNYIMNNFDHIDDISIAFYNYMLLWINSSIENIDALTEEEFFDSDVSLTFVVQHLGDITIEKLRNGEIFYNKELFISLLKEKTFDFDDYKIKIKMKLEKIKAALELEGPQTEAWSDYISFKAMQCIYYYLT